MKNYVQPGYREAGRKTELRPGIGFCDDCGKERWPQKYMGYGIVMCLDCIKKMEHKEKRDGRHM